MWVSEGVGRAEQEECGGATQRAGGVRRAVATEASMPASLLGIPQRQPRAWPSWPVGSGASRFGVGQEHCWVASSCGEAWRQGGPVRLRSPLALRVATGLGLPHRGPVIRGPRPS